MAVFWFVSWRSLVSYGNVRAAMLQAALRKPIGASASAVQHSCVIGAASQRRKARTRAGEAFKGWAAVTAARDQERICT